MFSLINAYSLCTNQHTTIFQKRELKALAADVALVVVLTILNILFAVGVLLPGVNLMNNPSFWFVATTELTLLVVDSLVFLGRIKRVNRNYLKVISTYTEESIFDHSNTTFGDSKSICSTGYSSAANMQNCTFTYANPNNGVIFIVDNGKNANKKSYQALKSILIEFVKSLPPKLQLDSDEKARSFVKEKIEDLTTEMEEIKTLADAALCFGTVFNSEGKKKLVYYQRGNTKFNINNEKGASSLPHKDNNIFIHELADGDQITAIRGELTEDIKASLQIS